MAALLCFAGGYLTGRYGQNPGVVQRTDVTRLQQLVRTAEATARRDADTVAAQLAQGKYAFGPLLARSTYPTFVFENGQLRYWSDATLRPENDATSGPAAERMVKNAFGEFLLLRRMAGRYLVLTYVPLKRHYGINNRYLRDGGAESLFRGLELKVVTDSAARNLPRFEAADGRYLFSIRRLQPNPLTGQYVPLALLVLGIVLYAAGWLLLARRWWLAGRGVAAVAALVLPLGLLRGVLLYLGLPYSFIELPLFDPRVYAVSLWAPSLGDLLLNSLLALLLAYGLVLLWGHFRVLARVRAPRTLPGQALALVGIGAAFCGLLASLFSYYSDAFSSTQLSLDVTRSIQVTGFRLGLALAVLLHTGAYLTALFLLTQLTGAVLQHLSRRALLLGPGLAALLALALGLTLGQPWVLLLGVLLLFAALVRAVGLQAAPTAGNYQTSVLLVLLLALASATGALALYGHFEKQLLLDKQQIASNLLVDNDLQGEFLLGERIQEIAADPFVRRSLLSAFSQPENIRRRVARQYLGAYFDKYESSISLYDAAGQPLGRGERTPSLAALQAYLQKNATQTDQPGIYLLRSANSFSSRRYLALATVGAPAGGVGPVLGTVRVELTLKKLSAYSVLPELLVDQKFSEPGMATQLSYAGYDHGQLVYSEGDFDYGNDFMPARLQEPRLYSGGVVVNGFHHLAVRGSAGRTVVVTTATYSLADWLANFSFQFLSGAIFWLLLSSLYLLVRGSEARRLRLNFSTRIQLLLNAGIVIPLLVVSVATASQLIAAYQRDLAKAYERRGQLALESLRRRQNLLGDSTRQSRLLSVVRNVATLTETDLNLYDARGELLASSQPLIFEAGLLGPLLNPQAVVALRERGQQRALLTEQAGSLSFNALYLPLRASSGSVAGLIRGQSGGAAAAADSSTAAVLAELPGTADESAAATGPIVGYVGIPFFDSEKELNTKLTELFTTILNIFTLLFLLFLGLAFVAARQLTAPLKLIAEKLTHTTLTGENELLTYQSSDDEIGLLVREYNTMLTKLEASKQELAAQEKEAAWREMARQVAHEIKNPLTPMKLSLQFLQKAINERRPNAEELIGRISQTLITQIDVLSDIATSFSTFTNLPTMRPERLDVAPILRRCTGLHQPDAADGSLDLSLPDDADTCRYVVFADENLLVRTFNNLLINARQAVPADRIPHIAVALETVGAGSVRVTIRDNGAGIPEEVQEKVFVPNFTTKESGSGIGLAVAKRGIESAGGKIWFETVVGEGTTFFIELPLAG
ncbi:ATP-binding protein [Hymenobacter sp. ASUV-10]|uniref:histidine kinase n=1 Tax=Hymenobacter aranciens TaxID=3063996 RepID=A0ABT9BGK5_9BACT|nr:ATP-binding protein [Hymenobacter sp. ASUV-10]MDO7876925.1 ATP-binding protein [Hymenobacter sp. ASUV-10]